MGNAGLYIVYLALLQTTVFTREVQFTESTFLQREIPNSDVSSRVVSIHVEFEFLAELAYEFHGTILVLNGPLQTLTIGISSSGEYVLVHYVSYLHRNNPDFCNNVIIQSKGDSFIANTRWHKVYIILTKSGLSLSVDRNERKEIQFETMEMQFLFNEYQLGTKTHSPPLCLRNIFYKSSTIFKDLLPHNISFSEGVLSTCGIGPEFLSCFETGCESGEYCLANDVKSACMPISQSVLSDSPGSSNSIVVLDFNATEGESTKISIDLSLKDPTNYLFRVTQTPSCGSIIGNLQAQKRSLKSFRLSSLLAGNISYAHNGVENDSDSFTLDLYRKRPKSVGPVKKYRFDVFVESVNDPTEVVITGLPEVFYIEYNNSRVLTTDYFKIIDADDPPAFIEIYLIGGLENLVNSKIEILVNDEKADTFKYSQLIEGNVAISHRPLNKNSLSYLSLTLSFIAVDNDTQIYHPNNMLTIEISKLSWQIIYNQPVTVSKPYPEIVTNWFLTMGIYVVRNLYVRKAEKDRVTDFEGDVLFTIQPPLSEYVVLERQNDFEVWQSVGETFFQNEIFDRRLRLNLNPSKDLPTNQTNLHGSIKLIATYGKMKPIECYIYYVLQRPFVNVTMTRKFLLPRNAVKRLILHNDLWAHFVELNTDLHVTSKNVFYTLLTKPSYGDLILSTTTDDGNSVPVILDVDSNFTNYDITLKRVQFIRTYQAMSHETDVFSFYVTAAGYKTTPYSFIIKIEPVRNSNMNITNSPLSLMEGSELVITSDVLNIEVGFSQNFVFTVTEPPKHGKVLLDANEDIPKSFVTNKFSKFNISDGLVSYKHDGSETKMDSFTVDVSPVTLPNFDELAGYAFPVKNLTLLVPVRIRLVNDKRPVAVRVENITVVFNSKRRLSEKIFLFHDPDVDFDDDDLVYAYNPVQHSQIRFCNNGSTVLNFTQRSLRAGSICLQHIGFEASESLLMFWVSDGDGFETATTYIKPSDAYININVPALVEMKRGTKLVLNDSVFEVETNMYLVAQDVSYHLVSELFFGSLSVGNSYFTHANVRDGMIVYESQDQFEEVTEILEFNMTCQDLTSLVEVNVLIRKDLLAPKLTRLSALEVKRGGNAVISMEYLHAYHSDFVPYYIKYYVNRHPKYGRLKLKNKEKKYPINSFSQEDINNNLLVYEHTHQRLRAHNDSITFEVTNGDAAVDVVFEIEIMPNSVTLIATNVSIGIGQTVVLSSLIRMEPYFMSQKDFRLELLNRPMFGTLVDSEGEPLKDSTFMINSLPLTSYAHVGSTAAVDILKFTCRCARLDINCKAFTQVFITIRVIDKFSPVISKLGSLYLIINSECALSKDMIEAADRSTGADKLVYKIEGVQEGSLFFKSDNGTPITSFTQSDVNKQLVVFRHIKGQREKIENSAIGFTFKVTDGSHVIGSYFFTVIPQKLTLSRPISPLFLAYPFSVTMFTQESIALITSNRCQDNNQLFSLIYEVIDQPRSGILLRKTFQGYVMNITRFDGKEISKIGYLHKQDSTFRWMKNDRIRLRASVPNRTVKFSFTVDILVAYNNTNSEHPSAMKLNLPIFVQKNGKVYLSGDVVDASNFWYHENRYFSQSAYEVAFLVKREVKHGWLLTSSNNVLERFTMDDIMQKKISYTNNLKDDSSEDVLSVKVGLWDIQSRTWIFFYMEKVYFRIILNNEKPLALRTKSLVKINLLMYGTLSINNNTLLCTDLDTHPMFIRYNVRESVGDCFFADLYAPNDALIQFTQQSIDSGSIVLRHDGESSMDCTLSLQGEDLDSKDVINSQVFLNFAINVMEPNFYVAPEPINLLQGEFSVRFEPSHLNMFTNVYKEGIKFFIKQQPQFGVIMLASERCDRFLYNDIVRGRVAYKMNSFKHNSNDSFVLAISHLFYEHFDNVVVTQEIQVVPKVKITKKIVLYNGMEFVFNQSNFDTGMLTKKQESTLGYTIISISDECVLKLYTDSNQGRRISTQTVFSQSDINSRSLVIMCNATIYEDISRNKYQLSLEIIMVGAQSVTVVIQLILFSASLPSGNSTDSKKNSNLDLIAVIIPAALLTLFVCVIVLFLCRRRGRKRTKSGDYNNHLSTLISPPLEYSTKDTDLPRDYPGFVKVTPLVDSHIPTLPDYKDNNGSTHPDSCVTSSYASDLTGGAGSHQLLTERSAAIPSVAVTRLKRHIPHIGDPNAMLCDPVGASEDYDWNHSEEGSCGYRDSPTNHPSYKTMVRMDGRGYVETRTLPTEDQSLLDNGYRRDTRAPGLRQSQYWL